MPELGAIKGNIFPSRARQPSASRHGGDAGETKEEIKTTTTTNKLLLRRKKKGDGGWTELLSSPPPPPILLGPAGLCCRAAFPGLGQLCFCRVAPKYCISIPQSSVMGWPRNDWAVFCCGRVGTWSSLWEQRCYCRDAAWSWD